MKNLKNRILIVGAILFVLGSCFYYVYGTSGFVSTTVERLDHKITGSGDSRKDIYLVFTKNGVFENTDSWLWLKFDSSDVQGELKQGKQYILHYYGWRVPFLSWYPNIIDVE